MAAVRHCQVTAVVPAPEVSMAGPAGRRVVLVGPRRLRSVSVGLRSAVYGGADERPPPLDSSERPGPAAGQISVRYQRAAPADRSAGAQPLRMDTAAAHGLGRLSGRGATMRLVLAFGGSWRGRRGSLGLTEFAHAASPWHDRRDASGSDPAPLPPRVRTPVSRDGAAHK